MAQKLNVLKIDNFKSGLISRVPDTNIPEDAFAAVQNIDLDDKFIPTKSKGYTSYLDKSEVLDQENAASTGAIVAGTTWQSFTPAITGELRKIGLYFDTVFQAKVYNINIREGEGSSGLIMYSFTGLNVPIQPLQWTYHTLTTPINLIAEQKYTIEVTETSVGVLNWAVSVLDPYSRGRSGFNPGYDQMFRTYMWSTDPHYPVQGATLYTLTSGAKYYVFASNGKIYYSVAGSKTATAYQIGGSDLEIDDENDVEFVQYNNFLYIVNGTYPIIKNGGYATSRMIKINDTIPTELTAADIPQGLKYLIVHQERLFGASSIDEPNGLYWTEPYDPEDWTPTYGSNYTFIGKDDGENLTGIFSYQGYVFTFKPRNIYRFLTLGDITEWTSNKVDTKLGSLYFRTIQELEGYLYYLSPEGVIKFDGNNAIVISEQIRDEILNLPQIVSTPRLDWLQTSTTDFNAGTFDPTIVDTSNNELKQNSINATANWIINRGLLTAVDGQVKSLPFVSYDVKDRGSMAKGGNYIYTTLGNGYSYFFRLNLNTYTWESLAATPTTQFECTLTYDGTYIYQDDPNDASGKLYRYNISSNIWEDMDTVLGWSIGQSIGTLWGNIIVTGGYVYYFSLSVPSTVYLNRIQLIGTPNDQALKVIPSMPIAYTGQVLYLFNNEIYITLGNNLQSFSKYAIGTDTLTSLTNIPNANGVDKGNAITDDGTDLYMVFGDVTGKNKFYRYNVAGDTWTQLTDVPYDSYEGAALSFDGSDTILYLCGDNPTYPKGAFTYSIAKDVWNPYVISKTIDYRSTPITFGNIAGNITGNIVFQTKSSGTDLSENDWENLSGWSANIANNGAIPSTLNRYLRVKVIPNITSASNILNETYVGAEWLSRKKDLTVTPTAWGKFESINILNGQTATYWMRTATTEVGLDGASWVQQYIDTDITTTLNRWIQLEIRFNSTDYSQIPIVYNTKVNYYVGTSLGSPCSVVWKDEYWLNISNGSESYNNQVYKYHKNGFWLVRTNKHNNIYFIDGISLLSGTSINQEVIKYNDIGDVDGDIDIDSWFETKNYELTGIINLFRKIYITSKSDENWMLSYSIDNGVYTDVTINSQTDIDTVLKTLTGIVRGQFIKFKIRQNVEDPNFQFHRLQVLWKSLREINSE
jgi:hypothetical protein